MCASKLQRVQDLEAHPVSRVRLCLHFTPPPLFASTFPNASNVSLTFLLTHIHQSTLALFCVFSLYAARFERLALVFQANAKLPEHIGIA